MAFGSFFNSVKRLGLPVLAVLVGGLLSGCPRPVEIPPPGPAEPRLETGTPAEKTGPAVAPSPSEAEAARDARRSVAEEMVRQGRSLLDRGQADAAIRVLERAAAMDPADGRPYFYLAEAWYRKQNAVRAREFHALAERALGADPGWAPRIGRQMDRIDELEQ